MKPTFFLLIALSLLGCTRHSQQQATTETTDPLPREVVRAPLQAILDTAQLRGAILIYEVATQTYYCNDFAWARVGRLPASTYKIPHSLIALETGVVADDSTLFPWDGEPRRLKVWEEDLIFRQAFHRSCVPCYQQIARQVGVQRMREQLDRLDYGAMQVRADNLDTFWLTGESKVSPFQQIDFLLRFFRGELPLAARTMAVARPMFVIDEAEQYRLSGKTGWAIREGHNNGWFVGYLEVGEQLYVFATNVDPTPEFDMRGFTQARKDVTLAGLRQLGFMPE